MTIDQMWALVQGGGVGAVFALMWYLERKERLRMQRLVEGFLPTIQGTQRAIQQISRVVGASSDGGN